MRNQFHYSPEDDQFGGIFDTSDVSFQSAEETSSNNPDMYNPSHKHKKAVNKTYSARGRFIPNVNDKQLSKIDKYMYYFKDPEGNGFYVDCPSNLGQKHNLITTAFFFLRDMENKLMKDIAGNFSRKLYSYALFHIMKDIQEEDLINKIKIFRFPSYINNLIEELERGDESLGKPSIKVFDIRKGKDFFLKVNEKTYDDKATGQKKTRTSYDDSTFADEINTISLDGGNTRTVFTGNPEADRQTQQTIFQFLKQNSPDLSQVKPTQWDESTEQRIIESMRAIIGDQNIFNQIYTKSKFKPSNGKNYIIAVPSQPAANFGTVTNTSAIQPPSQPPIGNLAELSATLAPQPQPQIANQPQPSVESNMVGPDHFKDIDFDNI